MAKKDMTGPFIALIGSLVYLYIVWIWAHSATAMAIWTTGTTNATFWLPIFAGLGTAATFSVLLIALAGLGGMMETEAAQWAMKANFMAAVSLFALSIGTGWIFWLVALGLILGQIGVGKMMM